MKKPKDAMAVVMFGSTVKAMKGKLGGSFFRNNTYGTVLQSNNWSKRGTGARHKQARFQMGQISSTWRDLTNAEREAFNTPNLIAQHPLQQIKPHSNYI
jgi:hypothetical protein